MLLNIDGFYTIHRRNQYFKNQCIDTSNIDVKIFLPIPTVNIQKEPTAIAARRRLYSDGCGVGRR